MLANPAKPPGKFARASFVLAFVKRDELSKFILDGEPLRGIARRYDRNPSTVKRAIELLKAHEAEIGRGDIMAVAKLVWRDHLGWERSENFIEARGYIDRGEIMPKETCGRKKRLRRKTTAAVSPNREPANLPASPAVPAEVQTQAAPRREIAPPAAGDTLLSDLASAPLLKQAAQAAAQTRVRPAAKS